MKIATAILLGIVGAVCTIQGVQSGIGVLVGIGTVFYIASYNAWVSA